MDAKCSDCGRDYCNVSVFWRCPMCATENSCTQPTDARLLQAKIAALTNRLLSQECAAVSYSNVEVAQMVRQLSAMCKGGDVTDRFKVQWCGHYREETHPYAWGVCDRNSNAVVGWGNPSKEWAERIAHALNIVEGQESPTPPNERDCESCKNDGDCYITVLKCKGYSKS